MWKIIGTAVQGRGHVRKNIPVQDKIFYHKGEVNVIALADGAGSAKLSHYGAERTVETACNLLKNNFDRIFNNEHVTEVQQLVLQEILGPLKELSEKYQEPISQLASTLLAVAVKNHQVLILHLGDGEIGAIKNEEMVSVSSSENGEYANSTYFTTSSGAVNHLKLFKSNQSHLFSSFFLMSDGTAHSLYSKVNKKFSPVIERLSSQSKIHNEEILNELLEESFEDLVKQQTNDDCSFIMMTLAEQSPAYLSMDRSDKEFLFDYLNRPKHCSIRKWDAIVNLLRTPLTLRQITKALHIKKSYVNVNLKALQLLGVVVYKNGKFHLVESSDNYCEN